MKKQIFLSVLVILGYFALNGIISLFAPLVSGEAAALQLENSNASYLTSRVGMYLATRWVSVLIPIALLVWIWWKTVVAKLKADADKIFPAALLVVIMCAACTPAMAYYDVKDRPEFIEIQPNQSAFMIPLQGANKESQKKFMSEQYLTENKVASKRIQIPHVILDSGVATERNRYIPSVKLIIVDRTPYNRNWSSAKDRGTSGADQGMRMESSESIDFSTDVVIAARIKEEDSAKYLYYFGTVNTKVDPNAEDKYPSVAHARDLASVMDLNVHDKVQSLLAREFGKYPVIECIKKKADIMVQVEKEVIDFYGKMGITIDYVGYAAGLTYGDPAVQAALNKVFVANTEAAAAPALRITLPLKMQEAEIAMVYAKAEAIKKWDGKVPNWLLLPEKVWEKVLGWFDGKK